MIKISILDDNDAQRRIDELAAILHDCVTKGASVSFMNPFTMAEAIEFYTEIADAVSRKEIILFAALESDQAVGTCQLIPANTAERLYERAGYQRAGVIPNYALWPDGGYCDTVYFYKWFD